MDFEINLHIMSSQKNKINYNKSNLEIFTIISSWIVAPIVGALLLGSWLDEKYNHENFFTLTFIAVAFIITCVGIAKEALKAIKSLE